MDITVNEDLIGGEDEAEVSDWAVSDGDSVAADQVIGTLETSKVQLEIKAPTAGIVRLKASPGQVVGIGAVIATIE